MRAAPPVYWPRRDFFTRGAVEHTPVERGMLFNRFMIRKLLQRDKTRTLRTQGLEHVNKPHGPRDSGCKPWELASVQVLPRAVPTHHSPKRTRARFDYVDAHQTIRTANAYCPFGMPGDVLWARETYCQRHCWYCDRGYKEYECTCSDLPTYRADYADESPQSPLCNDEKWTPSIHMPRWASRITLKITDIDVVRLHDIEECQVGFEGFTCLADLRRLWDKTTKNKSLRWANNPWAWWISFAVTDIKS